jgi:alkylation response protein AidB-like acyl-CoA dehydrogenase
MDLSWTPGQLERRTTFRKFAERVLEPGSAARDGEARFDLDVWQQLANRGFWRAHVPKDLGGDGGTIWDFLAAFEGLAAGTSDFGFVLSAVAHAGLIHVLLTQATYAQQVEFLPPLLSGAIGATAATELGGGSHVSGITTVGRRVAGGYALDGAKAHITNAPIADWILVVGRIPDLGRRDITLFLVPAPSPGVSKQPPEDLMGQRSSPTGGVAFRDVRIPESAVVGVPGDGLAALYSFLAFDRLLYGVAVAGTLEGPIATAMRHVRSRVAFGVPLSAHQLIQDKFVRMKTTMETSRWLAYAAAASLSTSAPDASVLASISKLVASEGMVAAGLELIQLFGHAGYERGMGMERILRDAVALRLAGGSVEMQKKNVFKYLVDATEFPLAAHDVPPEPAHTATSDGGRA